MLFKEKNDFSAKLFEHIEKQRGKPNEEVYTNILKCLAENTHVPSNIHILRPENIKYYPFDFPVKDFREDYAYDLNDLLVKNTNTKSPEQRARFFFISEYIVLAALSRRTYLISQKLDKEKRSRLNPSLTSKYETAYASNCIDGCLILADFLLKWKEYNIDGLLDLKSGKKLIDEIENHFKKDPHHTRQLIAEH